MATEVEFEAAAPYVESKGSDLLHYYGPPLGDMPRRETIVGLSILQKSLKARIFATIDQFLLATLPTPADGGPREIGGSPLTRKGP